MEHTKKFLKKMLRKSPSEAYGMKRMETKMKWKKGVDFNN